MLATIPEGLIADHRFLIVDDHAVVRGGIAHILKSRYPTAEFVECESGEDACEKVVRQKYSLVFLDVSMPGQDGIETLQLIKQKSPQTPVIMLSVFNEEAYALRAYQLGASAYLEKSSEHDELLTTTSAVLAGKTCISDSVAEKVADGLSGNAMPQGVDALSPKEHSIFLRLAAGNSLKVIASDQGISPKTVSTYRSRILQKLGLDSNAALARFALKNGLIQ